MFGSIGGIIATLLSGGKVAGLTLGEIEAIAGFVKAEEPAIELLVGQIKKLEPKFYDALKAAAANVGKPTATIPGYSGDGSVTEISNPNA